MERLDTVMVGSARAVWRSSHKVQPTLAAYGERDETDGIVSQAVGDVALGIEEAAIPSTRCCALGIVTAAQPALVDLRPRCRFE